MTGFTIHLDEAQYTTGDAISGRIKCIFDKETTVTGILLRLEGEEYTWAPGDAFGCNTFFTIERRLLNRPAKLGPGLCEYPFSLVLPLYLPSSYQSECGWIKYQAVGTLKAPEKDDLEVVSDFIVDAPINLNRIKSKSVGLELLEYLDDEQYTSNWTSDTTPITLQITLERKAFVVGDIVKVRLELTNMSEVDVLMVEVELGMKIENTVTFPTEQTRSEYLLLANRQSNNFCGPGLTSNYTFHFEVPNTPMIPNFSSCMLFKVFPTIKVVALLPNNEDLVVNLPIILGHIPVRLTPIGRAKFKSSEDISPKSASEEPPELPRRMSSLHISKTTSPIHATSRSTSTPPLPIQSFQPPYPPPLNNPPYPPITNPLPYPPCTQFPVPYDSPVHNYHGQTSFEGASAPPFPPASAPDQNAPPLYPPRGPLPYPPKSPPLACRSIGFAIPLPAEVPDLDPIEYVAMPLPYSGTDVSTSGPNGADA